MAGAPRRHMLIALDVHAEALGRCAQASNTLLGFLVRAMAVMDSGKYKLSSPMSNATTRSLAEVRTPLALERRCQFKPHVRLAK